MENFNINFIVFSPTPTYIDYIGGVMVCHSLANSLSTLGENSYIYADETKSVYNTHTIPWGTDLEFDKENTILILPAGAGEHTFENYIPENLKSIPNKIRWLINDQVKLYSNEDQLYKYCDYFKSFNNNSIVNNLASIDIEYDIFYNKNLKRSGGCFYTKGQTIQTNHHKDSDICLDNIYQIPQQERNQYLARIFNETEYFICYSHRSFTAVLAALCRCIVIVIPYDDTPYEYWVNNFPTMKYGISYGFNPNNIKHAKSTTHLVKENLQKFESDCIHSISKMRDNSYKWLQQKYKI